MESRDQYNITDETGATINGGQTGTNNGENLGMKVHLVR